MRRPAGPPEAAGAESAPDRPGPSGTDSSGSGAPARWARRLLLAGAAALALLGVAYGGAAVLLHTLLDPATLSRWIEPRAEAALNRDVEMEGARIRVFPYLGAELTGVRVSNLPDFEGPPLARIRSARLQVALLPLFRRRIRVDEIRIDEPEVRLARDAEGRTNYGDLVPESREPGTEVERAPLRLAVRTVEVRDGAVSWSGAADSTAVALEGVELRGAVEADPEGGWSGVVRIGADSLVLRHTVAGHDTLRLAGPAVEAGVRASRGFGDLEIREGRLRLGGAELRMSGRVEGMKDPIRRVDLRLAAEALSLAGLLEMVPASAGRLPGRVAGTAAVDLRLEGAAGPDQSPALRGSVEVESLEYRDPDGRLLVEGVEGRVEVEPGRVTLREVAGTVLGGPFSLSGTAGTGAGFAFEGRLAARPRLEEAGALLGLPDGASVAGRLDAGLEVEGRMDRPAEATLAGSVGASELRVEHPALGVPVAVEQARVLLNGRRAEWSDVVVELGRDRLTVAGSLDRPLALGWPDGADRARLGLDVRGGHLDLDAVFPPKGDPSVTYGRIAFARLGGRTIRGRAAEAWAEERGLALPGSLPLAGEARFGLDTLRAAPHRLTDVDARVAFAPELLEVSEASFTLYGGTGDLRLRMGLGRAPQPFSLTLRTREVGAADFLEATSPLGRHVSGTLSLEMELAGELDGRALPLARALGGSARIRVRDGGLRETRLTRMLSDALGLPGLAAPSFDSWTAPVAVEGDRIRFEEAALEIPRLGALRFGGGMGLDGSLDLGLRLAVPAARLDSLALGRSGLASAVAGRWGGEEAPLALGLSVTGTLEQPRIAPRAALATGELRRALEAEVRERAGAAADSARARVEAVRDTTAARLERARDTARSRVEARAREEAEEARRELQDRARGLLRGLVRPRGDTVSRAPDPDTTSTGGAEGAPPGPGGGESPPDTTRDRSGGAAPAGVGSGCCVCTICIDTSDTSRCRGASRWARWVHRRRSGVDGVPRRKGPGRLPGPFGRPRRRAPGAPLEWGQAVAAAGSPFSRGRPSSLQFSLPPE